MAVIDIGSPAVVREYYSPAPETIVNKGNPANADGIITSVKLYSWIGLTNCEVATFYRPDPDNYPNKLSTRDTEFIGNVGTGYSQHTVSLNVKKGDYIGIYSSAETGGIYVDISGGDGAWDSPSDLIPCTNQEFYFNSGYIVSIYGTGVTIPEIDIGVPAQDYTSGWCHGTLINKSNPANASGKITGVAIYTKVNMINVTVAIFYRPDPDNYPNNLTTRDGGNVYLSDLLEPGYHGFEVNLNVIAGDFIGIHYTNGDIEKKIGGEQGIWYINYQDHVPCTNQTFYFQAGNAIAIYGEGEIPVVGIKWNGVTISKWNGKVITKLN